MQFHLPGWAIVAIVCVICGTITSIVNKIIDSRRIKPQNNDPQGGRSGESNAPDGVNINVNVDNVDDYIKLKDYEKNNMQCPFCGSRAGIGGDGVCKGCGGRVG